MESGSESTRWVVYQRSCLPIEVETVLRSRFPRSLITARVSAPLFDFQGWGKRDFTLTPTWRGLSKEGGSPILSSSIPILSSTPTNFPFSLPPHHPFLHYPYRSHVRELKTQVLSSKAMSLGVAEITSATPFAGRALDGVRVSGGHPKIGLTVHRLPISAYGLIAGCLIHNGWPGTHYRGVAWYA